MGPSSKAWQRAQSPVGAHPPELLGAGCGEFHATADGKALCKLNSSAVGMFVSVSLRLPSLESHLLALMQNGR